MRSSTLLPILLACLALNGCFPEPAPDTGYVPVYGPASMGEILLQQPRPVNNPGKIYIYGTYLLVNEQDKGIHVFDNSNPAQPKGIAFIQMLGNRDMAIKDGLLYADHLGDLVAVATGNFTGIEAQGRLPLRNTDYGVPPPPNTHHACVETGKGMVIGWKEASITNRTCYGNE